jgi:hypothetical protein
MRIGSSDITMQSGRAFIERHEHHETLRVWIGPQGPRTQEAQTGRLSRGSVAGAHLARRGDSSRGAGQNGPETIKGRPKNTEAFDVTDSKLYVTKMLIERLTGRKIRILDVSALGHDTEDEPLCPDRDVEGNQQRETEEGWGLEYSHHESHYESESTAFHAEGVVKTKDGEEIRFALDLQMDRDFLSQEKTLIRAGDAAKIDPLVINFNGSAAELTNMQFTFDLDADGSVENIPTVRPGSGFLAFDINQDGIINNGHELFGPRTGNGFAELAAYDQDGNNWIDENDPVYDTLSIWTKDQEGKDTLTSLGERGVGALYLASVGSEFHLRDAANHPTGEVASTGIYVREDGEVGTIQQVNLAV